MHLANRVLCGTLILLAIGTQSIWAQGSPYGWMVRQLYYPNGELVPAVHLSFRGQLVKPGPVPVPGYVTDEDEGCWVMDGAVMLFMQCANFSEAWADGDSLHVMIFAENDPETGLTDSVLLRDRIDYVVGQPYQYYDEDDVTVPIELLAFSAELVGRGVVLSWTVANEVNNLGFYVQRAFGRTGPFQRISELVPGRGTSSEAADYDWTDTQATGNTLYYMLEDVSFDGCSELHGPIRVILGGISSWGAIKAEFAK